MDPKESVIEALNQSLADTYALYLKTQNYHWNIIGPYFYFYHKMFEEHYREMAEAIDTIAERIRALGRKAPGGFKAFSERTKINENVNLESSQTIIEDLLKGHHLVIQSLLKLKEKASAAHDVITEDLSIQRLAFHEKTTWMLRSSTS